MRIVIGEKELIPQQISIREVGRGVYRLIMTSGDSSNITELEMVLDAKTLTALKELIEDVLSGSKSARWVRDE